MMRPFIYEFRQLLINPSLLILTLFFYLGFVTKRLLYEDLYFRETFSKATQLSLDHWLFIFYLPLFIFLTWGLEQRKGQFPRFMTHDHLISSFLTRILAQMTYLTLALAANYTIFFGLTFFGDIDLLGLLCSLFGYVLFTAILLLAAFVIQFPFKFHPLALGCSFVGIYLLAGDYELFLINFGLNDSLEQLARFTPGYHLRPFHLGIIDFQSLFFNIFSLLGIGLACLGQLMTVKEGERTF